MIRIQYVASLVLALSSLTASAGPLLDRFMPYTDYYAEGTSTEPCDPRNQDPQALGTCLLDESTQATLRGLLGENLEGTAVTMDDVANALRDLLAQGQPVNAVVDALPLFIRQQLPNILQSQHCHFLQNGEVSAHFDNTDDHTQGEPYDEFISVTVYCDDVREFKVVLTGYAEDKISNQTSTPLYQSSSVPVKLVTDTASYPARVSFLSEGRLLSEQVFTGGFGETDIPILVRLHAPTRLDEAPKGHGKIVGFPESGRLVIYELN